MKVFTNAMAEKFGHLLQRFAEIGWRGSRVGTGDVSMFIENMKELRGWVAKRRHSMHIYLLKGNTAEQIKDQAREVASFANNIGIEKNVLVELANEPNIDTEGTAWIGKPKELGIACRLAWNECKQYGVEFLSPSVSGINKERDVPYIETMMAEIPPEVSFAIHRYTEDPNLSTPYPGYSSRDEEIAQIKRLAGGRKIYITETGLAEGPYKKRKPFPKCWETENWWLSEDDVANEILADMRVWHEAGIDGVVYYQLNDGPDRNNQGNTYGWRHFEESWDGPWKVVAQKAPELIKEVDEIETPEIQPSRPFVIHDAHLHEPDPPAKDFFPCSISLFYGLAMGISRQRFQNTIDGLAGKVQEARLNMSTFTWGNPLNEPEVIPFLPGNLHEGYSNKVNPAFLDEMEWRVDYMIARGVRPQLTLFWGGFQPMFRIGDDLRENDIRAFERAVMERGKNHPAMKYEWMNECDHGHHMAFLGYQRRKETLKKHISICKEVHPGAEFGASDGGHPPREWYTDRKAGWIVTIDGKQVMVKPGTKEIIKDSNGDPLPVRENKEASYYDYRMIREIDDWKVHFPRDTIEVEGFPRWARGLWHLNGEFFHFREKHPGKGYGQNDENMFLQTPQDHAEWPYRGSTRDWKMCGLSAYIALTAKAAQTWHTQSGFFCREKAGFEPITERVSVAYQKAIEGFAFRGMASFNTGWQNSPISDYQGPFKAFALVGGDNRRTMLFTVLNPKGKLVLNLGRPYVAKIMEITGEVVQMRELEAGSGIDFPLPNMSVYPKGAVIRLDAR
jgi:hypothetical protein